MEALHGFGFKEGLLASALLVYELRAKSYKLHNPVRDAGLSSCYKLSIIYKKVLDKYPALDIVPRKAAPN